MPIPEDLILRTPLDKITALSIRPGTRKHLSIDHMIPESKGGKMELSNLQTLCQRCNCKKGSHVVEG